VSKHAYQIRRHTPGNSARQFAEAGSSLYSAAHALALTVKTICKARRKNDPGDFAWARLIGKLQRMILASRYDGA
jgi:hypothetical protein